MYRLSCSCAEVVCRLFVLRIPLAAFTQAHTVQSCLHAHLLRDSWRTCIVLLQLCVSKATSIQSHINAFSCKCVQALQYRFICLAFALCRGSCVLLILQRTRRKQTMCGKMFCMCMSPSLRCAMFEAILAPFWM